MREITVLGRNLYIDCYRLPLTKVANLLVDGLGTRMYMITQALIHTVPQCASSSRCLIDSHLKRDTSPLAPATASLALFPAPYLSCSVPDSAFQKPIFAFRTEDVPIPMCREQ